MEFPEKLGKYKILGELGRGAMGVVYEGHDPDLDRNVAIKTLRKDTLDKSESSELLERFKREAQAGGRLQHPNIVSIHAYGEDDATAFIAMEIIHGKELRDLFDGNQRFTIKDSVRLMTELLDALEYAHSHGVVHRDIKPSNIIVMDDGHIKITDFGIARLESSTLTQAGTVLGTPSHMSPEQFMGQAVDGRSDLFSAGVILYQFLTGEKPFVGASISTIMHRVLKETPPNPSELNVQVQPPFDVVVQKAIAKRPDDRYQSAAEFRVALLAAMEGKDVAEEAPPQADQTIVTPPEAAKRARWPWFAAAGAVVAALGAGVAVMLTPGDPPKPPEAQPFATPVTPPPKTAPAPSPATPVDTPADVTEPAAPAPEKAKPAVKPSRKAEKPKPSQKQEEKSAKKRGVFGEELKPSPWQKPGF